MNQFSYHMYEMAHLALAPARAMSDATRLAFRNPMNPVAHTAFGRNLAASAELFERLTRRYGKPAFGLDATRIDGRDIAVTERVVWSRPFCNLIHFFRETPRSMAPQPRLLVVAPISGHYATLLRGTVEALLPHFEVYITDWVDARMVPLVMGGFDLDDYIDYVSYICRFLGSEDKGGRLHTLGVCQPSVPLIAAVALMEADGDPLSPASMILMGGPIDTRRSPTAVNRLAEQRGPDWFRRNCVNQVPFPYPGVGREVYPGFLQLSGFMAMNFDKHVNAHVDMFNHLVDGDGDSAEKHRDFYDEYMAVMDLDAAYYLQTVDTVFVRHELPKGEMLHRHKAVDLSKIRRAALMTIEGENDDISGVGQTQAAHDLCVNIPASLKAHYLQAGVGHYGVFNGSRYRAEIAPRIRAFIESVDAFNIAPTRKAAEGKTKIAVEN